MTTNDLALMGLYVDIFSPKGELHGILLDAQEQRIVATDTRALIAIRADVPHTGIIRKTAMDLVVKSTTKAKPLDVEFRHISNPDSLDELGYSEYDNVFAVKTDLATTVVSSIKGEYPSWRRIMPEFDSHYSLYNVNGADDEKEGVNDVLKVTIIETEINRLVFAIAKFDVVIEERYVKPLIDYGKKVDVGTVKVAFRGKDLPLRIECDNISLAIMPIIEG